MGKSVIRSEFIVRSKLLVISSLFVVFLLLPTTNYQLFTSHAIVDPLSVPNNKFGIHIIQATPDESSPAASLVNSSGGDWGYITVLIESKDRSENKWRQFFNDLRRRHLIPLVRLATQPVDSHWKKPYDGEEQAWADFLDNLNWPTKNRYIIIYNEPNHSQEWDNQVDAKLYAETLERSITALKTKNRDFFVLNGGLDASAPSEPPYYEDEINFLKQMDQAVPGIFNKLDGWVSHSYPNPNFSGSPQASGRGTIRTWEWELSQLRALGLTKNLPVFITETGWKHAEGLNSNFSLPNAETVADYYRNAFENVWNTNPIVAVTPFLLSYLESPFDHFSFKKPDSSQFYPQFKTVMDLPKVSGQPVQENKAELTQGEIFSSVVAGEIYNIFLTFKNIGQSIWNDGAPVMLVPTLGGQALGIESVKMSADTKVEPGADYTFPIKIKAPQKGIYKVVINLFADGKQFDSPALEFRTEVKSPVILQVETLLKWKKDPTGQYLLRVSGPVGESVQYMIVNSAGKSDKTEARFLLPDYTFDFSLEKPYYLTKTINQTVHSGVNILDFGELQPDILSVLLKPKELWKLLPFSN